MTSRSGCGAACTRRRARLASWRAESGLRSTTRAISSNGTAKTSCRTNARRSAGLRLSSTTSRARPIESASSACCSGPPSPGSPTSGSGSQLPAAYSRLALRDRSMSRLIRPTTVVSQARRSSMAPVSLWPSRSQASCTASCASLTEPSMP